jgi:adenosylmethionine-8-amino-7-oxononanoate aminotransferase
MDPMDAHPDYDHLQQAAKDHLWMHFTRHSAYDAADVPVIVRGEGAYLYDAKGKRYLDGLAGLFVSQLGHGRTDLAEVAAKQAAELAFMPLWSYAHPSAIELAEKVAGYAPGDLNRVFFTSGGGEAVETAWKLAKNYFKLTGKPMKHKVISRAIAYHGTTQCALSITGLPLLRSRSRSRTRAPTPSPRSSWSPCRTPAAASRRRPATSSGCARSATSTTCCWSPTR